MGIWLYAVPSLSLFTLFSSPTRSCSTSCIITIILDYYSMPQASPQDDGSLRLLCSWEGSHLSEFRIERLWYKFIFLLPVIIAFHSKISELLWETTTNNDKKQNKTKNLFTWGWRQKEHRLWYHRGLVYVQTHQIVQAEYVKFFYSNYTLKKLLK